MSIFVMLLSTFVASCSLFIIMVRYLVFMDSKSSSPSFHEVYVFSVLKHSVLDMVNSGTPKTVFET